MSVARACDLHAVAMFEGLWLAPYARVRPQNDDTPLKVGVLMTRDRFRKRVTVQADTDGTNITLCQGLVKRRAEDGTWGFATLVERNAMPPSPTDAWLLAEFTAAIVQNLGPRGPMAVVALNEAEFQIACAYQHHSVDPAPIPFRSRNEAVAWLESQGF